MRPTPSPGLTRREIAAHRRNPVFVDGSGRRARRVRVLSIAAVGVVAAYLVMVVVSLLGVPTIVSPLLPQPFAATGTPLPPDHASSPQPSEPTQPTQPADDVPSDTTTIASPTAPGSATTPSVQPAVVPAPDPTAEAAATEPGNAPAQEERGNSTTAPGQATAPGQTAPPTPPTRP